MGWWHSSFKIHKQEFSVKKKGPISDKASVIRYVEGLKNLCGALY